MVTADGAGRHTGLALGKDCGGKTRTLGGNAFAHWRFRERFPSVDVGGSRGSTAALAGSGVPMMMDQAE
jgi:hypothetical protein